MDDKIISKTCPKCKEIKFLSEFSKDCHKKSGHQVYCKLCHKAYRQSKEYKASRKKYESSAKGKAAHKRYEQKPVAILKKRISRLRYAKSSKGKLQSKLYKLRHLEQTRAQHAVNHAIERGCMRPISSQKCCICTKQATAYHHWKGYSPEHWLDVVPVCTCHHKNFTERLESRCLCKKLQSNRPAGLPQA